MSARSYLTYEGPNDLYVEMGLCDVVPRAGESVEVDGKRYVVASVEWLVRSGNGEGDTQMFPPDYYPQQHATVKLKRARRGKS